MCKRRERESNVITLEINRQGILLDSRVIEAIVLC